MKFTLTDLLEAIKAQHNLKTDAALAAALEVQPPVISKLKSGALKLGAVMILRLHEQFDIPVRDLRALAAA